MANETEFNSNEQNPLTTSYCRLSPSYLDGYSTFYVDGDNKIYRHTVEEVRRGRDKEKVPSMIERIAAIVNRQPVSQQPALMKGPM